MRRLLRVVAVGLLAFLGLATLPEGAAASAARRNHILYGDPSRRLIASVGPSEVRSLPK